MTSWERLPDSSYTLLEAASRYAALGFRVVPLYGVYGLGLDSVCTCRQGKRCTAQGKHPRLREWQKKATTDPRELSEWFRGKSTRPVYPKEGPRLKPSNIGIAMGADGGEWAFVAVDIDGEKAFQRLRELARSWSSGDDSSISPGGEPGGTLISRSGRKGMGLHYIYKLKTSKAEKLANSASKIAPGIDVRSTNGQIVVAPSLHMSGRAYEWQLAREPAIMPDWLFNLATGEIKPKKRGVEKITICCFGESPYISAAMNMAFQSITRAAEGTRNTTLNYEALCLGRYVGGGALDRAKAEDVLTRAGLDAGLPKSEVHGTVRSGLDAGIKEPRGIPEAAKRARARRPYEPPGMVRQPPEPPSGGGGGDDNDEPERVPFLLSGDLHEQAQSVLSALESNAREPRLYTHWKGLARVSDASGRPEVAILTDQGLKVHLMQHWAFEKAGADGNTRRCDPANNLVSHVAETCRLQRARLPELRGVIRSPVFAPSGRIVAGGGYDAELGQFVDSRGVEIIRPESSAEALALLRDCLGEFPFAQDVDSSHALCLLFSVIMRPCISGNVPLFMVTAPTPGTGKTLLVETLLTIAEGQGPGSIPSPGDDAAEWAKKITATLQSAPQSILIDNISGRFDAPHLAGVVTQAFWNDRLLGTSETVQIPNRAVWVATANNPRFSSELLRRTVRIRLDARCELPHLRSDWRHSLPAYAMQARGRLLGAAVLLVEKWFAAGAPRGSATLGSFEQWASTMSGVLEFHDLPSCCPVDDLGGFAVASEDDEWRDFVPSWWDRYQGQPTTCKRLFDVAETEELLELVRGAGSPRSQQIRMGKRLAVLVGRVFGKWRIERDTSSRKTLYKLVPLV